MPFPPIKALAGSGLLGLALTLSPALADEAAKGSSWRALLDIEPILDLRLQYQHVEDDGFSSNADAFTARLRGGFKTGEAYGLSFLIEGEGIIDLGIDNFNDTINGQTQLPTIPDPDGIEINRAQLRYTGFPKTELILGRQRIDMNNRRFLGSTRYTKNERTYDAIGLINRFGPVTLTYFYIDQVQTEFGNRSPLGQIDSNSHFSQIETTIGKSHHLKAYSLILDLDETPNRSTHTHGLRAEGSFALPYEGELTYEGEVAHQEDMPPQTANISLQYYRGALKLSRKGTFLEAGYEVLEGNGTVGLSTPLQAERGFLGSADVFAPTPANGVKNFFVTVGGSHPVPWGQSLSAEVVYHDFRSENTRAHLGHEVDGRLTWQLTDEIDLTAEAAFFKGNAAGPADRTSLWFMLNYQLGGRP